MNAKFRVYGRNAAGQEIAGTSRIVEGTIDDVDTAMSEVLAVVGDYGSANVDPLDSEAEYALCGCTGSGE